VLLRRRLQWTKSPLQVSQSGLVKRNLSSHPLGAFLHRLDLLLPKRNPNLNLQSASQCPSVGEHTTNPLMWKSPLLLLLHPLLRSG
jgi:hypothetical protein